MNTSNHRRQRILAEVFQRRHVTAKDLATVMDVSEATVRRDLKTLADTGHLELVYGGATLRRSTDFSSRTRESRNPAAKQLIGRLASTLVADDDQIFIDSGTTTFEMTPFLKPRRGLSIIINSTRLASELDAPGISILMLGGQYRPDRHDTVGPLAASTLTQLRGYLCFIGADGLAMDDFGLSASDIDSANLYRLAVQNARETILLVDHTKFSSPSLFQIVSWTSISKLVTNHPPTPEWSDFLAQKNIQTLYPTPTPHEELTTTRK